MFDDAKKCGQKWNTTLLQFVCQIIRCYRHLNSRLATLTKQTKQIYKKQVQVTAISDPVHGGGGRTCPACLRTLSQLSRADGALTTPQYQTVITYNLCYLRLHTYIIDNLLEDIMWHNKK